MRGESKKEQEWDGVNKASKAKCPHSLNWSDGYLVGYCAMFPTWCMFKHFHNSNLKIETGCFSSQKPSGNASINTWHVNVVNTEEQHISTTQFTWKCHFKPQNRTVYFSCVSAFWKNKCRKEIIWSKSVCLLGIMFV